MRHALRAVSFVLAASLALAVGPAAAQDAGAPGADAVAIELNKLEAAGGDCQATVVATNGPERLRSLRLDLVVFDGEGVVAKRLAAELGPLAARKTVIKTFPVRDLACTGMSRIVLNDVLACEDANGPVENCIDRLELRSRADNVSFAK